MKSKSRIAVGLGIAMVAALVVTAGCSLDTASPLTLHINGDPSDSHFGVVATGPDGSTVTATSSESVLAMVLPSSGEWTISVSAYDEVGKPTGRGSITTTAAAGVSTEATVDLSSFEVLVLWLGDTELDLSVASDRPTLSLSDTVVFSVTVPAVVPDAVPQWYVDGVPAGLGSELQISGQDLGLGESRIDVTIIEDGYGGSATRIVEVTE